jgi:hypothetical protein
MKHTKRCKNRNNTKNCAFGLQYAEKTCQNRYEPVLGSSAEEISRKRQQDVQAMEVTAWRQRMN